MVIAQTEVVMALNHGLEQVGALIENTARAELGDYQGAVGPFPAWAPLSPAYEAEKGRSGYATPNPLVRTGEMLASFQHEVDPGRLEVIAGATDEKMLWHELGTAKMPPRPVWGPAALRNGEAIAKLLGAAAVAGLMGDVNQAKALYRIG
jgi:hypothetical protein